MRTAVAFVLLAVLLMATGVLAVAAFQKPRADLFMRPPVDAICDDAYFVRESGTLTWLTLEGGMWEFNADGTVYDLDGAGRFLTAEQAAWLVDHPGTGVPATVEGIAEPCIPTVHMHGVVLRVTWMAV